MTTLGIIGAGYIGTSVAKAAIVAGYEVVIANSRGPETLNDLIEELGPKARAATAAEAAAAADFALVAVPLGKLGGVPVEELSGKLVLDANNYYPQRDGRIAALDANESTTSELVQAHLPGAYVVKAFNNIPAAHIPVDGLPAGDPARRALPVAGDDKASKQDAIAFLSAIGFDAVDLGPLSESWRVERDTPAYVKRATVAELTALTTNVTRVQQV